MAYLFNSIISFIIELVVIINVLKVVLKQVEGLVSTITVPTVPSKPSKETTPSPPTPTTTTTSKSKETKPSGGKYLPPKQVRIYPLGAVGPFKKYSVRVVCPDGTKFTDTITWKYPISSDMLYCYCNYVFNQLVCMPHIYINPKLVT